MAMCYSSLMPEVIFALYWHSVEIQEHHAVAPLLQLFKFTRQKRRVPTDNVQPVVGTCSWDGSSKPCVKAQHFPSTSVVHSYKLTWKARKHLNTSEILSSLQLGPLATSWDAIWFWDRERGTEVPLESTESACFSAWPGRMSHLNCSASICFETTRYIIWHCSFIVFSNPSCHLAA